jgi:hypothetical protein
LYNIKELLEMLMNKIYLYKNYSGSIICFFPNNLCFQYWPGYTCDFLMKEAQMEEYNKKERQKRVF